MRLAKHNTVVTRQRLVTRSWCWGPLNEPPIATALYFGEDGLIKICRHDNEHSSLVEDRVLHILNKSRTLFWRFEIMFLANGRLALISRLQNSAPRPSFSAWRKTPRQGRWRRSSRRRPQPKPFA